MDFLSCYFPSKESINLDSSINTSKVLVKETNEIAYWSLDVKDRLKCDELLCNMEYVMDSGMDMNELGQFLKRLNDRLEIIAPFIINDKLTLADLWVWHLFNLIDLKLIKTFPNVFRYKNHLDSLKELNSLKSNKEYRRICENFKRTKPSNDIKIDEKKEKKKVEKTGKDYAGEGKFIELENAVDGEVVVRFPPEASGYLHIGHAKAALLNQHYKEKFKGKLILRFDDTNPEKEDEHFEKIIEEDLKMLNVSYDSFTRTSDYFDLMMEKCEFLLKNSHAYCDNTDGETMKKERENCEASKCRNLSVDENLKIWNEMKNGNNEKKYCVRAKIDYESKNGCLRDPVIYRSKTQSHVRHGTKYKVYPTYDFACPIVDSIEGVTHALRTTEYHDRDDQFHWFINKLGLRSVNIWEYSRLNLQYTLLSKRKLAWFVDEKIAEGWNDPRFPTVRGIVRRGMDVEALKQFVIAQGSSRSNISMSWDKIWAINKKVIDPKSFRFTALRCDDLIEVEVKNVKGVEMKLQRLHPKFEEYGMKEIWYGSYVLCEEVDFVNSKVDDKITLLQWGNFRIDEMKKKKIILEYLPDDKDFKKTVKVSWILNKSKFGDNEELARVKFPHIICIHFEHLLTIATLDKGDDFKKYINPNSRQEFHLIGESAITHQMKLDQVIQLQRKGFYRCDETFDKLTNKEAIRYDEQFRQFDQIDDVIGKNKFVLFDIPDESTRTKSTSLIGKMSTSGKPLEKKDSSKSQLTTTTVTTTTTTTTKNNNPNEKIGGKEGKKEKKSGKEVKKEKKSGKDVKKKEMKKDDGGKKETKLGITVKKMENFPQWYHQVITKGDMIDYYDVSGCYILKPWSMYIWEFVRTWFDGEIKKIGVDNCYFPIFVTKSALEKEASHIDDFAPEVAWVTQSGNSKLEEPIAVRPTSETVMYPAYSKWIQSHRDLPLKLNQWNNVVRWEFKHPQPFIRSREFLWQEGHTAHADKQSAIEEVHYILNLYRQVYEDLMAIPVICGKKTEKEKFAGADFTTTIEAFIHSTGRGVQAATSHHLGQNFSKMFDIGFEDPKVPSTRSYVYQNSWGLTTRSIGVMIMVHGDDKGLVLPPKVAKYQIVLLAVGKTITDELKGEVKRLEKVLNSNGVRTFADMRDHVSNELGEKEMKSNQLCLAIRCRPQGQHRQFLPYSTTNNNELLTNINQLLQTIHEEMLEKARTHLNESINSGDHWNDLVNALNNRRMCKVPFCGEEECEGNIKKDSAKLPLGGEISTGEDGPAMGAKSLCIPNSDNDKEEKYKTKKCIKCGKEAKMICLFGRSY
ncbi:hypothetical protein SNEBB_011320 [Seison nebaliae]|nr:hypothetical protein SNEBB_011320 [Seison nebaliae]